MGKIIGVKKELSREDLDNVLAKLTKKRPTIDLDKYAGKINFGVDGLEYQFKNRNEWKS